MSRKVSLIVDQDVIEMIELFVAAGSLQLWSKFLFMAAEDW
jgi:hypothetical protein